MRDDMERLTREEYRAIVRQRMLRYGFTVSLIGLPIGILMNQPVVWGLALAGILVGGAKLMWG